MINIQIMNGVEHPARVEVVSLLRSQAEVCVHRDPYRNGPLATMLSCLICGFDSWSEWVVVLQDDAMPVEGWQEALETATHYSPEPVLGLTYFGYGYSEPKDPTTAYFRGRYVLQGGGFAIHRSLLQAGMIPWLRVLRTEGFFDDDVALAAFSRWTGHQTACVTHALFTQPLRSSLKNRPPTRPLPQKTIAEGVPTWATTSVEDKNLGKCAEDLGLLLRAKYDDLRKITPTTLSRDEVWW